MTNYTLTSNVGAFGVVGSPQHGAPVSPGIFTSAGSTGCAVLFDTTPYTIQIGDWMLLTCATQIGGVNFNGLYQITNVGPSGVNFICSGGTPNATSSGTATLCVISASAAAALLWLRLLNAQPGADPIVFDSTGTRNFATGAAGALFQTAYPIPHALYGVVSNSNLTLEENGTVPGTIAWAWGVAQSGGGVGVSPAITPTWQPTALIDDLIKVAPTYATSGLYSLTLTDQAIMSSLLRLGIPASITDGLTLHEVLTIVRGLVIFDKLLISSTLGASAVYGLSVLESLKLSASLQNFFSGVISDFIGMHDGVLVNYLPTVRMAEAIGIGSALSSSLVFGMEIDDNIEMSHSQLMKMIFSGTIADGLQLRALYVSPDGSYTTWAVNTRTGAVTEYQNFVFNSFTQMGHRYLGANDQGIWLLDGARDDTDNIVARIKSGKMSVGGSKFTTFRQAYLGLNTNDNAADFVLKMVAGDGREYIYAVKPNAPGTTTKVNMGKGLRSRYFSFELISQGADFDLDNIEFVPLVSERRV